MQENQTSTKRYSYRREVIYDTLKATTAHPDVDAIYAAVREKLPGVGVATVYRNLRALVEETPALTEKAEKMGFTVKSEKTVLYGICPDCAAKNRS